MKLFNSDILDRYLRIILDTNFPEVTHYKTRYNFWCNVCGDGSRRKNKKRGWILKDRTPWMFYCHNCNETMTAEHWMRQYFPTYHTQYIRESYKFDIGVGTKLNTINTILKAQSLKSQEYNELEDVRYFVPLYRDAPDEASISLQLKAREYCIQRQIPIAVRSKWYVATGGRYRDRLVIPFYDNEGKIYSYQCRSLTGKEPKYTTRVNSKNNIYNYFNVDKEKPVVILEGAIDSLFVENSIAVSGLKIRDPRLENIKHKYFLLDNDVSGGKMSAELIEQGEWIFIWRRFMNYLGIIPHQLSFKDTIPKDDINDIIVRTGRKEPFSFKELNPFFSKNRSDYVH